MPPKTKADDKKGGKSKQIQAAKAATKGSGGSKGKKKKWSKGKQKEKVTNAVLFDKPTFEKLLSEVPKYKLITASVISERLKVNGSLARKALKELTTKGLIRLVCGHSAQSIYTRATNA
mmetsp:Transcript_10026/g.17463  ORF Transcript_10026/g.17463 Transcript_10026/m.17463 type:complete len:119 (-) Transcript_10026:537-893(-)|eukprot:CAMPEP_0196666318 /NCGR_PEP_ID=MMETSP1086-20130531/64441_1 /TAXON_ID=77921 /ORGANISM="Cyanoptyche  gloeocystis , Strain SAG4.97" /LENGTH=118 /DNA_ID=CAMNT_0042003493 /DNA_START=580 /DNA_END=936 /DNA_ORIENTATION=+